MNRKLLITLILSIIIILIALTLINVGNETLANVTGIKNPYFAVDGEPLHIDQYNIDIPIHYTTMNTFYMFWQPIINGVPGPRYRAVPPWGDYSKGETFPISITGDPELPEYTEINLYASSDSDGRFAVQTERIKL
jgi:hypothetical protein